MGGASERHLEPYTPLPYCPCKPRRKSCPQHNWPVKATQGVTFPFTNWHECVQDSALCLLTRLFSFSLLPLTSVPKSKKMMGRWAPGWLSNCSNTLPSNSSCPGLPGRLVLPWPCLGWPSLCCGPHTLSRQRAGPSRGSLRAFSISVFAVLHC